MKSLYLIPLLTVSLILSSCFGSKEEAPEQESPKEPVASTPAENEATKPAGADDAAVDSSATGSAATESSEGSSSPPASSDAPAGSAAPAPDSASSEASSGSSAPDEPVAAAEADPAMDENPVVTVSTSAGDITIELFAKESPQSVANFLSYAKEGYYDNTVFHRVIEGFMVQGGGFGLEGDVIKQKDTKDPVQNEAKNGVKNARGTVAMARTSAPHSATSQFFINHADNSNLDYPSFDGWGYTVFGKVTEGMDVVDAIAAKPTSTQSLVTKVGPRPMDDVPNETIVIKSVKIAE